MDAVRSAMPYEEVTRRFRVSHSTILRWVRRLRESGRYAALPMGGKKPFVLADEREWLLGRFAAKPDLTLRELLSELHGRDSAVSYHALWNIVQRAGLHFQKDPARKRARGNAKRLPLGAARRRAGWRRWLQRLINARRFVFIDETWAKTNMTRLRGW